MIRCRAEKSALCENLTAQTLQLQGQSQVELRFFDRRNEKETCSISNQMTDVEGEVGLIRRKSSLLEADKETEQARSMPDVSDFRNEVEKLRSEMDKLIAKARCDKDVKSKAWSCGGEVLDVKMQKSDTGTVTSAKVSSCNEEVLALTKSLEEERAADKVQIDELERENTVLKQGWMELELSRKRFGQELMIKEEELRGFDLDYSSIAFDLSFLCIFLRSSLSQTHFSFSCFECAPSLTCTQYGSKIG